MSLLSVCVRHRERETDKDRPVRNTPEWSVAGLGWGGVEKDRMWLVDGCRGGGGRRHVYIETQTHKDKDKKINSAMRCKKS